MKKAALVFAIAVLLTACQKDKHLCVEDIDNFKPAPATIETLISNKKDLQDDQMNKALYKIAVSVKDLIQTESVRQAILSQAQTDEDATVNFLALLENNPAIKLAYLHSISRQFNAKTNEGCRGYF